MKTLRLITTLLCFALAASAGAQDLREAYQRADAERQAADERARRVEKEIVADRARLDQEVARLEARQQEIENDLAAVRDHIAAQEAERERLEEKWAESELDFKEISGNVRLAARDVETMLHQSFFTGFDPTRTEKVSPLLDKGYFPDIDDIAGLTGALFEEIRFAGQVGMHEAVYTGRDGIETSGNIITFGKFTAAYRRDGETGFLAFSPEARRFVALAKRPAGGIGRALDAYLGGGGEDAPIDLSGGSALAQVTHQTSFLEQMRAGGPIVWPLAGLALLALVIIVSRIIFLNRVHHNTDRFMTEVNELAARGDWAAAEDFVEKRARSRSPVIEVIKAGLAVRHQEREVQESVLQEAILHQLPRVERGLSVLAVLGAVAPLLGLLGTVTGMINTFRVITLFGTGDPKLMSGGISEALVTTEVGLAVAIPIMLAHTFLSRRSDHIVGEMEEKAVQLTNIIQIRNMDAAGKDECAAVGAGS